ncbi:hypothetical protein IFO70_32515 [Phormidium tenue FACHB-886]|nr:hypothetical protein [Phormidium tenue FACHB-886]
MFNNLRALPDLAAEEVLNPPRPPRFNLDDRVRWHRVPTQDFGVVVERFYGTEGSVQALGWHYMIQLDVDSPSFAHCKTDCGFEEDLALMEPGETDAVG